MKAIKFSIIVIIIFVISCSAKDNIDTELNETQNDTPELLEKNPDYNLNSISKRYHSDIITNLYNEALKKNTILNKLNDEINDIGYIKNDSIESYQQYSQTNLNYWAATEKYIKQIDDPELRESTLEIFESLESDYKTKISIYEQKLDEINTKTLSLNDQLILLKLSVTESMMKNYQVNELPNIKTFEKIISEYNRLIAETKEFSKKEK